MAAMTTAFAFQTERVSAQEAPPTRVRFFVPYLLTELQPSVTVTERLSGTCLGGSIADTGPTDAWRCSAGNRILDPCFAPVGNDVGEVACSEDPWNGDVILLSLEQPLPEAEREDVPPIERPPWALELAGGVRCTVLTGAAGVVAGMRLNYGCDAGSTVLGAIDWSSGVWRAHVLGEGAYASDQVPVTAAWY